MSKSSGSTRIIKHFNGSNAENKSLFHRRLRTGNYDSELSFISDKSGAFVLTMKGHNYQPEEIEAAKAVSNAGINVELRPEGARIWATKVKKDGTLKFAEGTLASINLYEQRTITPSSSGSDISVRQAINHAVDKGASVALIYDKYGMLDRYKIKDGMKLFEKNGRKGIKAVVVVNSKGEYFEHHFD